MQHNSSSVRFKFQRSSQLIFFRHESGILFELFSPRVLGVLSPLNKALVLRGSLNDPSHRWREIGAAGRQLDSLLHREIKQKLKGKENNRAPVPKEASFIIAPFRTGPGTNLTRSAAPAVGKHRFQRGRNLCIGRRCSG